MQSLSLLVAKVGVYDLLHKSIYSFCLPTNCAPAAPIAPELDAYWIVATKPPFHIEKARRTEKRKRSGVAIGTAGLDGNLGDLDGNPEDLEPLPMEKDMQMMDLQHEVSS